MSNENTKEPGLSSPKWEDLEGFVRGKVQGFIQDILEEEVTSFLGRKKSERRIGVDAKGGYRNGYGKSRKLTLSCGTIRVRRPRVRELEERFESRVLPAFARRTKKVSECLPELYLHGLSEGDFDLALRGLLGDEAPLSPGSIARLKAKWQTEYENWKNRSLADYEVVYLWVDGIYVKAGLEKDKAALLVAMAGLSNGQKVFVAIEPGYRESTESWSSLLRGLGKRGMNAPKLILGDGHLGIWGALRNVYPEADEQRCWNHKILNVLNKIPRKAQGQARELLCQIPYAQTLKEAAKRKREFQRWAKVHGYEGAAKILDDDWERMITFYSYPKEHWKHLRTTNPIESPFQTVRLRTNAAKRYKKVENATAVIWKTLMVAQSRFRKLSAHDLLKDVLNDTKYIDGVAVCSKKLEEAA
jgi:transposase-like protein